MALSRRHIFLSCGEASGERYGADLVSALHALDPDLKISALGGRHVEMAGAELVHSSAELGVMGFAEVMRAWPAIRRARRAVAAFLKQESVDLVVPVDFPGFNSWVAGTAHALHVPVFWLIAPQLWAWGGWRARSLRAKIDRLGTILPFEGPFFQERGFRVFPMGHPLLDAYARGFPFMESHRRREVVFNDRTLPVTVGLIPGSRRQELRQLLPILKVTTQALSGYLGHRPLKFLASVAPGISGREVAQAFDGQVEVSTSPLPEILPRMDLALVCSGTASLEAALAGVPHEIIYRTGRLDYFLARRLVRVPYIGLSNLILDRRVVREHIQGQVTPLPLASSLQRWISRPEERASFRSDVEKIRELCGPPGVWPRTAAALLELIDQSPAGARAPGAP